MSIRIYHVQDVPCSTAHSMAHKPHKGGAATLIPYAPRHLSRTWIVGRILFSRYSLAGPQLFQMSPNCYCLVKNDGVRARVCTRVPDLLICARACALPRLPLSDQLDVLMMECCHVIRTFKICICIRPLLPC